jgi:predicted nucleic acid-binding protein
LAVTRPPEEPGKVSRWWWDGLRWNATANAEALLQRPHVRATGEADGFWELFRQTSRDQARGNDVLDAHLITLMRQHGVRRIYSRDIGLRRYTNVDVVDPFAPPGGGRRSRRSAS